MKAKQTTGVRDVLADAVSLFTKDEGEAESKALRMVSLRMELDQLALVDAMSAHSGESRQVVMRMALRIGAAQIVESLPANLSTSIRRTAAERLQQLQGEA